MHEEKLGEVICETAEQMFFQEFCADSSKLELPEQVYWATIHVTSPQVFDLVLAAAEGEVRDAIELMFGADKDVTDARASDLVAELANTLAGGLARHLSDQDHLELSPPTKGQGKGPTPANYQAFSGDDLTLYVAINKTGTAA